MDRTDYAARYGPTTGDRIRLGDTDLFVVVERDDVFYGDEILRGWGKTSRIGLMFTGEATGPSELDLLISNVIVVDPMLGVFKTNIAVKDGFIAGTGRAGNPDITDGIDLRVGPNTAHIPGQGLLATPGGVDTHVHLRNPRLVEVALAAGTTTLVTAGLEDNPAPNLLRAFEAFEQIPLNLGVQGRASSYRPDPMVSLIEVGACGLKIHEDYAAYPSVIDASLRVGQDYDVAVALHTDGLNESGGVEETIGSIATRPVHVYHVEGVGGGHMPDSLVLTSFENIICSSTTPTIPHGVNASREHKAMLWAVHGMNKAVPSNRDMVEERVRDWTMEAETYLHELGAISLMTSDSIGMGRIGEVARRTWQLADVTASYAEQSSGVPVANWRVRKYLAKYTINPAITHGIATWVGSLEAGKLADIVLWHSTFFGVKPELIIKGGHPAWVAGGSGGASVQFVEPVRFGPDWGAIGGAIAQTSLNFVSEAGVSTKAIQKLRRRAVSVRGASRINKRDMVFNNATPAVEIDGDARLVLVDGHPVPKVEYDELPLNRRYVLA